MINSESEEDGPATVIACFDLDGVLVDSEATKIRAFREAIQQVLEPDVETENQVDAYNRRHRGVPRRDKFVLATAMVTGGEDEATVQALLDAYESILAERLPVVRAMPGAVEFTRVWPGRRAVVTSAPREEAESQLRRLNFPPFDYVFDALTSKTAALRELSRGGQVRVVFFGDAQADADAAAAAAVSFVAVGEGIDNLNAATVVARIENPAALLGKECDLARSVLGRR